MRITLEVSGKPEDCVVMEVERREYFKNWDVKKIIKTRNKLKKHKIKNAFFSLDLAIRKTIQLQQYVKVC